MRFAQIRSGALPARPSLVDYVTRVADWPMYLNDRYGDCVWAAIGHIIEAATTYGTGTTVKVTDADVTKGYHDVTGFNPNDPSTDNGTVIQDALEYWRKTGIGGHKILAYAEVNVKDLGEAAEALYLFGHLELGINFPDSAMDQFNAGQPWDVVPGASIEGGHAVNLGMSRETVQAATDTSTPLPPLVSFLGKNTRGNFEIVTWGKVVEMTPAFWAKYVEEAWVVITPEWLQASGGSPEGVDMAALAAAFTALTGEPFPVGPAPSPTPTPVPPAPVPDDVLAEVVKLIDDLKKGWAKLVTYLHDHGF